MADNALSLENRRLASAFAVDFDLRALAYAHQRLQEVQQRLVQQQEELWRTRYLQNPPQILTAEVFNRVVEDTRTGTVGKLTYIHANLDELHRRVQWGGDIYESAEKLRRLVDNEDEPNDTKFLEKFTDLRKKLDPYLNEVLRAHAEADALLRGG